MSSDGEDLRDGDNSSEGYMLWEEEVDRQRVRLASQAAAALELVCIDSGCNRLILMDAEGVDDHAAALNSYLRTAQATARLQIVGRGRIGTSAVMIIPDATANLMSTKSISANQCSIEFGELDGDYYCAIHCHRGVSKATVRQTHERREKQIDIVSVSTISGGLPKHRCLIFYCRADGVLKKNKNSKLIVTVDNQKRIS